MEFRQLSLEWKADGQGVIEGYGAVFDMVDNGGDIVVAGAFAKSLQSGRKTRMLFQHNADQVIGVWDEVAEDGNGLRVKGRILTGVAAGATAYELVKEKAIDGLSIGYRTVRSMDRAGKRAILEAELWEVSLVTFPMNEMARIDAVKAAEMSERDIERVLTRDAKFTRSMAQRLMAGGYDAIKTMRDAGGGIEDVAASLKLRCGI